MCKRMSRVVCPLDDLDQLAFDEVHDTHRNEPPCCSCYRQTWRGRVMTGTQAGAMRCPNCGAPASAEAARCEYCHSVLARVSCAFCFNLLFDGAAFCPHCGRARSRAEIADQQSTPCSSCKGAMRWVKLGTTDLLECESCDGTWLEAAAFERLCADRESQAGMLDQTPAVNVTSATRQQPEHIH